MLLLKKKNMKRAAKLRDDEKRIEKISNRHKNNGKRRRKNNRIEVTEDNVADVVSMMTGIPEPYCTNRKQQTSYTTTTYRK
jgi:ATP-dependent Clp protease ATP-binding subunit ClpC